MKSYNINTKSSQRQKKQFKSAQKSLSRYKNMRYHLSRKCVNIQKHLENKFLLDFGMPY